MYLFLFVENISNNNRKIGADLFGKWKSLIFLTTYNLFHTIFCRRCPLFVYWNWDLGALG